MTMFLRKLIVLPFFILVFSVGALAADEESKIYSLLAQKKWQDSYRLMSKFEKRGDDRFLGFLGMLYENGLGVPKSNQMAEQYYRKAIKNGSSAFYYSLAEMIVSGRATEHYAGEMFSLFLHSANSGDAFAIYRVASLYRQGVVVNKDNVEAYKWFNILASYSPIDKTKAVINSAAEIRDEISGEISYGDLILAQARSVEWQKNHEKTICDLLKNC